MNVFSFSGNLTREPEIRVTAGGAKLAKFGVAVNRREKNKSTGEYESVPMYLDCEVWGARAETISQHFTKGSSIEAYGELRQDTWEDNDGNKRSKLAVRIDNFFFPANSKNSGIAKKDDDAVPAGVGDDDKDIPF